MSTYNIRNLFPFKRVKISEIKTSSDGKITLVKILPDYRFLPICSGCLRPVRKIHSTETRILRDLPMSGSQVLIYYTYRKIYCSRCQFKVEHHDFIEPYARVTIRFAHYIHELCRVMTVLDVARHTGLSWDQVRKIDKKELKKRYSRIKLKNLRILCIDEISLKKRHSYLTIIANYLTGQVIAVLQTRTYEALAKFLKRLPLKARKSIQAVAMDMWDPYIKAFKEWCTQAKIVFDPFHVIANYSRVIDKIRREQYRLADDASKELMKKSRYLLLKNPQNLTPDQRPRLKKILKNNELLSAAYLLKDYLKRLWHYKYPKSAEKFLAYWCQLAHETESTYLIKFAESLVNYKYGLINHCRFPIHNAKLEGINNKIKVIKRKAYGYRDLEYFKLKIIQSTIN